MVTVNLKQSVNLFFSSDWLALNLTLFPLDEISRDEIALYDRQIRLWGVQAQEKYVIPPNNITAFELTARPVFGKQISFSSPQKLLPTKLPKT